MKPPRPPSPTKRSSKRNLAARALASPLYRPKIVPGPMDKKRKPRFPGRPDDETDDDHMN